MIKLLPSSVRFDGRRLIGIWHDPVPIGEAQIAIFNASLVKFSCESRRHPVKVWPE